MKVDLNPEQKSVIKAIRQKMSVAWFWMIAAAVIHAVVYIPNPQLVLDSWFIQIGAIAWVFVFFLNLRKVVVGFMDISEVKADPEKVVDFPDAPL